MRRDHRPGESKVFYALLVDTGAISDAHSLRPDCD